MVIGSIPKDITSVPNIEAPKYIKQILMGMKMETDNNTITAEDFSIPLSSMGRSPRQKINKETVALQDRLEQRDLIAICRTFHPKLERKISFLIAHGTFSRTYNM